MKWIYLYLQKFLFFCFCFDSLQFSFNQNKQRGNPPNRQSSFLVHKFFLNIYSCFKFQLTILAKKLIVPSCTNWKKQKKKTKNKKQKKVYQPLCLNPIQLSQFQREHLVPNPCRRLQTINQLLWSTAIIYLTKNYLHTHKGNQDDLYLNDIKIWINLD